MNNLWKVHQKILNYSEYNEMFVRGYFKLHPVYQPAAEFCIQRYYHYIQSNNKIHTIMGHLSLCKLVVPHLTSNHLECNLISQYHDINPICTEFQHALWLGSFLLIALTNLRLYISSSFFQRCSNSINPDAICLSFFNSSRYPMI